MAGYDDYQESVYHQTEDAILWPSVGNKFKPGTFDLSTMTQFTLTNDSSVWDNTTSSPSSVMSQSASNTDPMDRLDDSFNGSEPPAIASCPSFGMHHHHASQWHVQDQDLAWQSLDHCCIADARAHSHGTALQNTPLFAHYGLAQFNNHLNNGMLPPTSDPGQDVKLPVAHPLPDVFASTHATLQDPPTPPPLTPPEARPQRKNRRCAEDLYTPRWVRNMGASREGWCGWCSAWFTLRDSAYWYHMHYSHGVSQTNEGRRLPAPAAFRAFGVVQPIEWEVKCGRCARWMPLPPGDKWNTAYFRHTYKCYFKSAATATRDRSSANSPAQGTASPSRRRRDML